MKNKRSKKGPDRRHVAFTRFMLIVALFIIWIGGISVRLVHLQVNQHSWLKERALNVRQDVKQTRMLRGTVYDRNDRVLAISSHVKTLYADPTEMDDVNAVAKAVADVLKLNGNDLARDLTRAKTENRRFFPIAKKLEEDTVQKVNKTLYRSDLKKPDLPNFDGLHWRDDQKRSYPNSTLAAQVVGFTNSNDEGRAGVELAQDDALQGAVIPRRQERDRLGRVYDDETLVDREPPSDIVLTLDTGFQYITEQALEEGVRDAQAKSGMAIVMDPKTGEILAIANYPTFDPNTITEASQEHVANRAIQAVYSPGSVFKLITYGSALERRLISPEGMISAGNGQITVANHTFTDSHGVGTVTYAKALAQSSNVCAIKTGLMVGKDDFYGLLRKMGFGSRTGIELPAETAGIVRAPEKWNGDSLASMSIGYEIGVTALQMASAFGTIANDGVKVQPHIIKEVRRANEPKKVTHVEQTQVVTTETARSLRTMLREVVVSGTGRRAALSGYTAAGKTGTAWKFNALSKSVDSSKYISSFIGMAPANDPRLLVAVVMDEPKAGARDGGFVSAPVFKMIAQRLLQEMQVPMDAPIRPETQLAQSAPKASTGEIAEKPAADERSKAVTPSRPGDKGTRDNKQKTADPAKPKIPVDSRRLTAMIWSYTDSRLYSINRRRFET